MINFSQIDWRESDILSPEKWTWILLKVDFNLPVGTLSWVDPENIQSIHFKSGDIFPISWGSYQDFDKQIKDCFWIFYQDQLYMSSISKEFISINEVGSGGTVFEEVTKKVLRNNKLNKILD